MVMVVLNLHVAPHSATLRRHFGFAERLSNSPTLSQALVWPAMSSSLVADAPVAAAPGKDAMSMMVTVSTSVTAGLADHVAWLEANKDHARYPEVLADARRSGPCR